MQAGKCWLLQFTLSLVHQHLSTPSWPNLHKCHNDSVGAQEQTKRTVCFAYWFYCPAKLINFSDSGRLSRFDSLVITIAPSCMIWPHTLRTHPSFQLPLPQCEMDWRTDQYQQCWLSRYCSDDITGLFISAIYTNPPTAGSWSHRHTWTCTSAHYKVLSAAISKPQRKPRLPGEGRGGAREWWG